MITSKSPGTTQKKVILWVVKRQGVPFIERFEVDRVSDKSYWTGKKRYSREGRYRKIFDSFKEAKQYAIEIASMRLRNAERRLREVSLDIDRVIAIEQGDCKTTDSKYV